MTERDSSPPPRRRPSLDVPPSVLSVLSARIGEAPRVSLREEPSQAGSAPLIDPASSERASLPEGRGSYQILGEIARGGMGVVLRGHDTDLGRDVALKVLNRELADRPEVVQRFVEEAQIGGQLQHPGIVPVYELGLMADDRPYFTMKLVKGRTLAMLLAERESVTSDRRRLVDVFESICQTVAYAHSRGVIHRDLKPANIMVGAFGEVQVVDWGLAKVLARGGKADEKRAAQARSELTVLETVRSGEGSSTGSDSLVGSVLGTPAYMPPEQARGQVDRLDERADVFALGAILCEILTGSPPYVGDSDRILGMAAQGELDDAYARLESCESDAELVKLAKQCLVAAAAARPRNAGLLSESVHRHLEGVEQRAQTAQIEAAEARVRATQERKARRLTLLLAGAVLLLIAVGGGAWARDQTQRTAREARQIRSARALEREVEGALSDARLAVASSDWAVGEAAIERARALATTGDAGAQLRAEIDATALEVAAAAEQASRQRERERDTARLLAELTAALSPVGSDPTVGAEQRDQAAFGAFPAIFAGHGIDIEDTPPVELSRELRERGLGPELALLLDLWAGSSRAGGDERRALHLLEVAHEVDPDPVRADLREAAANGDLAMLQTLAVEDLTRQPAATLELLAVSLGRLGDFAGAQELLQAAVGLHPDDARLHRRLADMLDANTRSLGTPELRRRGRRQLVHAWAAVALDPENSSYLVSLGMLLVRLEESGLAREVLERALELDPHSAWARLGLATTLPPGDPRALELARQVSEQGGTRMLEFWGHYALAFALLSSGQIDAGVRATRQAESSMSNNLDEFSRILELYLRAGDIDAAEHMFQTSGAGWLDGHNNMAWFMATADLTLVDDARIRERMARQAVLHAEEALRTNPGFESVYNTLGIARLRAADYAGAREALQQSLAHQGGNGIPEDWVALAICEAELGNPEAARVWFERARPHVDGTIDRSLDGGLRLLVEQAARRLEVPSPLPPPR